MEALLILVPIFVALITAMSTLYISRRTSGGKVKSSQAADLWTQTQAIIDDLRVAKERAEDQRDKLLELQRDSTRPTLELISVSQNHILELLDSTIKNLEEINAKTARFETVLKRLEEGMGQE